MLNIARLFGKSPFSLLQTHMEKVASCMALLPDLFEALLSKDTSSLEEISKKISEQEHQADMAKNEIRNDLPKSLFLPIERGALLEILSLQDALSDQAEIIGFTATYKSFDLPSSLIPSFSLFCKQTMELFWLTRQVISELDELLEASFGGIEAEKVKAMVENIAFHEYKNASLHRELLKMLYQAGDHLSPSSFHLCHTLLTEIAVVSQLSEKLGNRIRMLLELK